VPLYQAYGGQSASASGEITLVAGTTLELLIGGGGGTDLHGLGGGGGGGTFAWEVTPGVPEAPTWALLVLGFGGLGFAASCRRTHRRAVA
jgi:hypothetical protein